VPNGVPIAGKTGTAQVYQRARLSEEDAARAEYRNRAHAWFAGFAPVESPEVAIIVMIEHGGSGGRYAAPVAVQILQEYLGPRYEGVSGTSGTVESQGDGRGEGPPPRGPATSGRP
jgi:penicillin-binding protein 2